MDHFEAGRQSADTNNPSRDMPGIIDKAGHLVVALLESASQAIVAVDRAGRIVLAYRRADEIFGYSREELLGARIEMLLPDSKRGHHVHDRDDYFARPRIRPMRSSGTHARSCWARGSKC